ncbi:hypothetical protein LTR78_003116 [Recurvomyces mirabilis]|uniref:Heterokaryon incompatibility domain-containing protein n=1 Tax=Recurvomyces mirabilis TaxID=574656 RepID=A0AAE0WS49_9PEZI|nr:hypothetical protein LTR78_003116 [Recurvomyces mirabilis]KAK5157062.1 hypothetical protein LTS14_004580 [Recurvomyces mirabilis]
MRLLNVKTLKFEDFLGDRIPHYVILSHRWGEDEISFKDFRKHQHPQNPGYKKVLEFCSFAKARGREWVWIDTCCIDKRSSAEVSEAVNSMFAWYKQSRECFALLSDVPSLGHDRERILEYMRQSQWFSRGWTLQELLSPPYVTFISRHWEIIGDRLALADMIHNITGIPKQTLVDNDTLSSHSVAQRISWAAKRETTRPEDIAYCLLGLLNVNMPLLYGEGAGKAFQRLQLQIIATSNDESILAWSAHHRTAVSGPAIKKTTILAKSPAAFLEAGSVTRIPLLDANYIHRPHHAMTNKGLLYQGSAQRIVFDRSGHHWSSEKITTEYPPHLREDVELGSVYII